MLSFVNNHEFHSAMSKYSGTFFAWERDCMLAEKHLSEWFNEQQKMHLIIYEFFYHGCVLARESKRMQLAF